MTTRDDDALRRQLIRYTLRFNGAFWAFFEQHVAPRLPSRPVMLDVGCGPGLYLRDLSERYPSAVLHGIDANEAMIENARRLDYSGPGPALSLANVEKASMPLADGSVDLLTMAAVLHAQDDPFAVLREVRRVLSSGGLFLLFDWVRVPMKDYLEQRQIEPGDEPGDRWGRALKLFPVHNKYTVDDWRWLLANAGFAIDEETSAPHQRSRIFLCKPA